jgi:mycothiol synthase
MNSVPAIRPAREEEWPEAFRLIFQATPESERKARVLHGIDMVRLGELQHEGIWVALEPDRVKGAMICLTVPGASALVWPPQAEPGDQHAAIEDALMTHGCAWLRSQGVRVAQSLLEEHDQQLAEPLLRNGFQKVTSLAYMRHDLNRLQGRPTDSLCYRTYREVDPELFKATLEQTYVGTLDCPELNGVRSMDEIVAGHVSQGRHDPERWWLAFVDDLPVAVLMLTAIPEWRGWDLSYLGVVPAARRKGFARNLAHKALWEARRAGQSKLTLSVDRRNLPARDLYESLGFVSYDRRDVYLGLWPADTTTPAVP